MKPHKMTRRVFIKRLLQAGFLGTVLSPLYAHYGERTWYRTDKVELSFPHLPKAFHGFKILHFSDVHYGFYYDAAQLEKLVRYMSRYEADLICFTGDLSHNGHVRLDDSIPIFNRLQAPFGKFAVLGNHDASGKRHVIQSLEAAGFRMLINQGITIQQNGEKLYLAGLDDLLYGRPDADAALAGRERGEFTITMVHEPDYADTLKQFPVDLQLSGHSHGGQIRLPIVGHLVTPPYARKYVDRLNQPEGSDMYVYVNRGIGTTGIPLRFFCRPEVTIIELRAES